MTNLGEHLQLFYGWCSVVGSIRAASEMSLMVAVSIFPVLDVGADESKRRNQAGSSPATVRSFLLDETNQKTRYENRGKERGRVKASTQLFNLERRKYECKKVPQEASRH